MTAVPPSVRLRPARQEEAEALSRLALRSKGHWGYDQAFLDACADELRMEPDTLAARRATVAEEDGTLLGFTTLEGEAPQGELGMLFVEPAAIGRGVGGLLFRHVLDRGRELGFDLLTIAADPHAEQFYLAMGAVRVGEVPSGSIPGRVLPLMEVRPGRG
ncbi:MULTISPECIES: GNAT family N-acetyltransferase [Streptacidiphilus]|uniref:GNAT family N-acetyltransferase n=1 Tax=Streptacidiphilus cavernicola TaxID=3342716 RepID=A0ABV6UJ65_9ACTN|nr:GNAT family N-acetyltransferase [Streptacidiphilus jeojiense]